MGDEVIVGVTSASAHRSCVCVHKIKNSVSHMLRVACHDMYSMSYHIICGVSCHVICQQHRAVMLMASGLDITCILRAELLRWDQLLIYNCTNLHPG